MTTQSPEPGGGGSVLLPPGSGSTSPPSIASRIMLPSTMPKPYCSFHFSVILGSEACPRLSELFCRRSLISCGLRLSSICSMTATKPATAGQDILVPDI